MPYRSAGCHFQSSLHSPPGSCRSDSLCFRHFFFQAEDGIRDYKVTGVQTCALPIWTRSAGGLRIIPTHGAGRELVAALARGEAVALVADRVVAGAGASVELFGAPARLPIGPAALAVETGVPAWLVAARRTGWGTYRTHIERIPLADEGSRRQRVRAFLDAQARAYERAIAQAPEQWWAIFFPIWEDGA